MSPAPQSPSFTPSVSQAIKGKAPANSPIPTSPLLALEVRPAVSPDEEFDDPVTNSHRFSLQAATIDTFPSSAPRSKLSYQDVADSVHQGTSEAAAPTPPSVVMPSLDLPRPPYPVPLSHTEQMKYENMVSAEHMKKRQSFLGLQSTLPSTDPAMVVEFPSSEEEPDSVLAQLLSMGFDVEIAEVAIAECVADRKPPGVPTQPYPNQSLLEACIGWLLARQGASANEARAVTYSPVVSPKPSRPPPPNARPARGILKVTMAPPGTVRSNSLFRNNNWLGSAISTLGRIRSGGKISTSSSSGEPANSTPSSHSNSSTHGLSDSAGSASNDSLNSLSNGSNSPNPMLAKLPKRVRFSFPEITIEPEPFDFLDDDDDEAEEEEESPTAAGASSSETHAVTSPTTLVASPSISPLSPELPAQSDSSSKTETGQKSTRVIYKRPSEFTITDLYHYYLQTCTRRSELPIEKLLAQLQNVIESTGSPLTPSPLYAHAAAPASALSKLDLSGAALDSKNVGSLADLLIVGFSLQQLMLENCGLEDEILKIVLHAILSSSTTASSELDEGGAVAAEAPTGGEKSTGLPWLSLANNRRLRTTGMKYVAVYVKKSKALQYLDISGLSLDKRGLLYLSHALGQGSDTPPCGATLQILRLDNCRLRSTHVEALIPGIKKSNLKTLLLRNDNLSWECATGIADMISGSRLEVLDLRGNDLRHGIAVLASAIAHSDTLRELHLRDNKMDPATFVTLCEALRTNQFLRTLDVSMNPVFGSNMAGVVALKDALAANHRLTELNLSNTGLSSEGAVTLAEALPLVTTLEKLDITHNPVEIAGALAISVSLRMNNSVTTFEVAPLMEREGGRSSAVAEVEDSELARLLNDITIYCQRNREIQRSRGQNPKAVSPAASASSLLRPTSPIPPHRLRSKSPAHLKEGQPRSVVETANARRRKAEEEMAAGDTSATLLEDILNAEGSEPVAAMASLGRRRTLSQEELVEQLYEDTLKTRRKLQELISSNVLQDEELVARIFALNDRLEALHKKYESKQIKATSPLTSSAPPIPPQRDSYPNIENETALVAPARGSSLRAKVGEETLRVAVTMATASTSSVGLLKDYPSSITTGQSEPSSPWATADEDHGAYGAVVTQIGVDDTTTVKSNGSSSCDLENGVVETQIEPATNGNTTDGSVKKVGAMGTSFGSLEELGLDQVGWNGVETSEGIGDPDEFMAEMSNQMREIDEFLNGSISDLTSSDQKAVTNGIE
ncbi:hypothetical protein BJ742DRAFT_846016 [Cladochytrium replicatum]|nr:hypothetical protein BJ742DRAFT_846016 [Cladochytrium replicatum]